MQLPDMPVKFIKRLDKEFNINHLLNIGKCLSCNTTYKYCDDCIKCDNYSNPSVLYKYTYKEFADFYIEEFRRPHIWSRELVNKFFENVKINMSGMYWEYDYYSDKINFYDRIPERGPIGSLNLTTGDIFNIGLSKSRKSAVERIWKKIKACEEYAQKVLKNSDN